jgi:hypothetical protein
MDNMKTPTPTLHPDTEFITPARFMAGDKVDDFTYGELANPTGVISKLGFAACRGWFKILDSQVARITKWYTRNGNAHYRLYLKSGQIVYLINHCGRVPGWGVAPLTIVMRKKDL